MYFLTNITQTPGQHQFYLRVHVFYSIFYYELPPFRFRIDIFQFCMAAAKARGADVILCDTAGRLHNKQNLMNELGKISRILDRELPQASKEVLLVLDATTGQNGLIQAREFQQIAGVTGIVLTKLDGTAKGGIVIAVANSLQIPVKYVGVGEQMDDLMPFDPAAFVEALV